MRERIHAALLCSLLAAGMCACGRHATDTAEYRFDKGGHLQTLVTPDGSQTSYSWSSAGSLEEVRYRGGHIRFGYDPAGMRAWLKDDVGFTAYSRDAFGRVRDVIWARNLHRLIHYDYDLWNHVKGIEVYNLDAAMESGRMPLSARELNETPATNENKWRQWRVAVLETSDWLRKSGQFFDCKTAYGYDMEGRMVSLEGPAGTVQFAYRDNGREVERRLPNGIKTVQWYDDKKRISRIVYTRADAVTLADYRYERDARGDLQTIIEVGVGMPGTTTLHRTGARLDGFDLPDGESVRLERDSSGLTTAANVGGRTINYSYDRFGRLTRAGNTVWSWNANGWLESVANGSRKVTVRYDGRGLPKSATSDDQSANWDFDALGRMTALKVNNQRRYMLADPMAAGDLPFLEWDASGRLLSTRVYGSDLIAETDTEGKPSYLLRDGLGTVRFVADSHGTLSMPRRAPWESSRIAHSAVSDSSAPVATLLASWWSPQTVYAAGDDEANPWRMTTDVDVASQFAQYVAEQNYFQRVNLLDSSVQGYNNEQKAQNQFQKFLESSPQSTVDVYLNGINNDWQDAAASTRFRCPNGECLFLPTYGSVPKFLDIPATIFEKLAGTVPFGDILQTRKMDISELIERANSSGKTLHAIVCESGCGFELERNVEALTNYAYTHPGAHLPELVIQSTDIGPSLASKLQASGYVVKSESESGIVPWLVRPGNEFAGPLRDVPVLGATVGFVGQLAFDVGFVADQFLSHQPIVGAHGLNARWDLVQDVLKADRPVASLQGTAPDELMDSFAGVHSMPRGEGVSQTLSVANMRDTFPSLEEKLGGIELAARATPEIGVGPIEGVVYDPQRGVAILLSKRKIGIGGIQPPDLAWALKLAYSEPPSFPQFSLDPADPGNPRGDWLKAVYIPRSLAGTAMGYTMFLSDWLMKQYSFGVSADYNGHVELISSMPGGLRDMFTLSMTGLQTQKQEVWTRLWIVADDFRWSTADDAVFFTAAKMAVRAKRQVIDQSSPTGLRDVETSPDPAAAQFARDFSDHYGEIAASSPEFARLTELAKAVALARWFKEKGVPADQTWIDGQLSTGTLVQKVHALTSYRDGVPSETRSVHGNKIEIQRITPRVYLFGGVDLSVTPRSDQNASAQRMRDATKLALAHAGDRRAFAVDAGGEMLAGDILPAIAAGQKEAPVPYVVEVNGTRREYSATGRLERLIGKDGSVTGFEYVGNRITSATERTDGQAFVRYSFDGNGSVARLEQSSGRAEIQHSPAGRIVAITFTDNHGTQTVGIRKSEGTEWSVSLPGYKPVRYQFAPDGNLDKVSVGDQLIANARVDSASQTMTVRDNRSNEERSWKLRPAPFDAVLPEESTAAFREVTRRIKKRRLLVASGDALDVVSEPVGRLPDSPDEFDTRRAEEARVMSSLATAILVVDSFKREPDGRIRLHLGGREVTPLQSVMDEFLSGGEAPAELDALLRADGRPARLLVGAPIGVAPRLGHERLDAMRLARALNRVYGVVTPSYLATDVNLGLKNLAKLPRIASPKDVIALAPAEAWQVKDYDQMKPIHNRLRSAGVEVLDGVRVFEQGNVLILSGHKDNDLRHYVKALGDYGSLKGKYILLFSCHAVGDMDLNATVIREYGATGIHYFGDELNINAVRDTLVYMADRLKEGLAENQSLPMLLRDAVRRAIGKANSERLKQELNKLLDGVTQVSELQGTREDWNG